MKRKTVITVVQVLAALIGLGGLYLTVIFHVMRTMSETVYSLQRAGLAVIVATTAAVLYAARRWTLPAWVCAAAVAVTLAAGVAPMIADDIGRREAIRRDQARRLAGDETFAADLKARGADIERRIAAQLPYTPEQAREFLVIAGRANRRASGGTDQSAAALVVLKRALEGKIVDPNTPIQGVRPGSAPEPLFIHYYNAWTRAVRERVNVEAWQVMKLLAQHGADLSLPAASEIAANLKKTEMPREWDGAMQLK